MRTSRVREKLKLDKPVLCTKINTHDPVVVNLIGLAGFDCVWICLEHIPLDGGRLAHLICAASLNNLDSVVRIARSGYSSYIHPLELGASGIMVPHCLSAGEAREVVRMTRFHPLGHRALDGGNADGDYCMVPVTDYMRHANANTFVVLQIEDPEAVEQVDEIAAVDGVDVLLVGPGDLAHAMGVPGQTDDPAVQKAIELVALACEKHGRVWGLPVNAENVERYLDMGARFCSVGADVLGLQDYYRDIRTRFSRFGFEFRWKV
jgi:4-hydroxy-2-oxoheptanedioate aldolase